MPSYFEPQVCCLSIYITQLSQNVSSFLHAPLIVVLVVAYSLHLMQYIPVKNERVLGIVAKTGKQHRVDIQGSVHAVLPELAFQGATKRNKPTLQVRNQ